MAVENFAVFISNNQRNSLSKLFITKMDIFSFCMKRYLGLFGAIWLTQNYNVKILFGVIWSIIHLKLINCAFDVLYMYIRNICKVSLTPALFINLNVQ